MRFIFPSIFGFIVILIFPEKKRKKTEKPETRHSYIIYRLALNISFYLGFLFWMINALYYAFQEKDSLPGCIKHPKKRDGSRLFVSASSLQLSQNVLCLVCCTSKPFCYLNSAQSICDKTEKGSCSDDPASWCFLELLLASSWIVGGQKMLYVLFAVVLCKWFGS